MSEEYKANILIVEDEVSLHESLKLNLEIEGYEVESAFTGKEAIAKIENEYYDLVVLDLMLPEIDGLTILETMRIRKINSAVLILSARHASEDRILGLKKGADDYLTKPFALEELLLRIEKLILKSRQASFGAATTGTLEFGGHVVNFKSQEAVLNSGQTIQLSKKETMLLQLLAEHAGNVVTREMILKAVWGYNVFPTTRTIDNFVLNLRKYFEKDTRNPQFIHSVRGQGYKFTT